MRTMLRQCGTGRWRLVSLGIPIVIAAVLLEGLPARAVVELRTVASGFSSPVYLTHAGDGSGRMFVVEQEGRIRILASGAILPAPFLDIRDRVRCCSELGLLGLAFHPRFPITGRFFVNYTRTGPEGLETVVAEYAVSSTDPNLAVHDSERILLRIRQPFANHNGGMIAFGPEGYLYIGTGDGGSGGDPQGNGQNLETLLGKILRIDVDSGNPYSSPSDNPFIGLPGRDEIWAYGLRNPWRFSFDRATGRLFAGDVGQNAREEIDLITRGGNYGWNIMEGTLCFSLSSNCNQTGLALPLFDYGRSFGSSVTGGYVYRGRAAPSLAGKYIFGDFGSGRLWALTEVSEGRWESEQLPGAGFNISSFGEDESGELYVLDYGGSVRQVVDSGDSGDTGASQPRVNTGGVVNAASFLPEPVAPGMIVSIFGASIGPGEGAGAQLDSAGRVGNFLAETQVFFDGIPAPLYFVRSDQINAQVPYGVAGKTSVQLRVQYRGSPADPVTVPVAGAAPGIFAVSGGSGQGAILHQDSTPNSAANPAPRHSVVTLYATGEGETTPAGADGRLSESPFASPVLPVSVRIGGIPCDVLFAGSAPGFAGLLQVNVRVSLGVPPGAAVAVELTIGTESSQAGVTLAVE